MSTMRCAPPGCRLIHLVRSKTSPSTTDQHDEADACFLTSAMVSAAGALAVGVEDADALVLADGLAPPMVPMANCARADVGFFWLPCWPL